MTHSEAAFYQQRWVEAYNNSTIDIEPFGVAQYVGGFGQASEIITVERPKELTPYSCINSAKRIPSGGFGEVSFIGPCWAKFDTTLWPNGEADQSLGDTLGVRTGRQEFDRYAGLTGDWLIVGGSSQIGGDPERFGRVLVARNRPQRIRRSFYLEQSFPVDPAAAVDQWNTYYLEYGRNFNWNGTLVPGNGWSLLGGFGPFLGASVAFQLEGSWEIHLMVSLNNEGQTDDKAFAHRLQVSRDNGATWQTFMERAGHTSSSAGFGGFGTYGGETILDVKAGNLVRLQEYIYGPSFGFSNARLWFFLGD